jgi:hypothetical protein
MTSHTLGMLTGASMKLWTHYHLKIRTLKSTNVCAATSDSPHINVIKLRAILLCCEKCQFSHHIYSGLTLRTHKLTTYAKDVLTNGKQYIQNAAQQYYFTATNLSLNTIHKHICMLTCRVRKFHSKYIHVYG